MNIALLAMTGLSLTCSAATLAIMVKMAKELKSAKVEVDAFKEKTNRNVGILKGALEGMEL